MVVCRGVGFEYLYLNASELNESKKAASYPGWCHTYSTRPGHKVVDYCSCLHLLLAGLVNKSLTRELVAPAA